ncbi:thioredoxin family protein [Chryseobacterium sp. C-71]|uniref:thioredoxin family protein n=1 Tax=Chryseobacterium sp. C-71 TaxID=2893882 RepID=UPI001E3888C9|nr:thioredoxin family protein [Chryseobacterium sp. C-71]UFH30633.1 thioredoxin family protein [Chryseobacterium sp. C-71]
MKNFKILMTALVVGLGLLSFTKINSDKNENQIHEVSYAKGYEVGDEAADFKLKNIDGKMVSLSDFKKAKGFIVIFTCNHCPYAKKYEERIVALDKKYKSQGYPVIAINPNDPNVQPEDNYQKMIERAKEKGFTFPYLVDEGQKIYPQYGATKTPHVFVLQKENGKNVVKYIGAVDNNYEDPNDVSERYVEDAVDALVKNQPIKMNKTVAIGCTIKVQK